MSQLARVIARLRELEATPAGSMAGADIVAAIDAELGSADWQAAGGSGAVGVAVVDFGASPVAEGAFTVTDAGVSGTSVIQAWVIGDSTADNDAQSHIQASRSFRLTATPGSGSFSLDVMALIGLCAGTFNIHYRY